MFKKLNQMKDDWKEKIIAQAAVIRKREYGY